MNLYKIIYKNFNRIIIIVIAIFPHSYRRKYLFLIRKINSYYATNSKFSHSKKINHKDVKSFTRDSEQTARSSMHAIYFTVFRDDPSIFILAGIGDDSLETRKLRREKVSCEQRAENSMTPDPGTRTRSKRTFFERASSTMHFSRGYDVVVLCSTRVTLSLDYETNII